MSKPQIQPIILGCGSEQTYVANAMELSTGMLRKCHRYVAIDFKFANEIKHRRSKRLLRTTLMKHRRRYFDWQMPVMQMVALPPITMSSVRIMSAAISSARARSPGVCLVADVAIFRRSKTAS